MIALLAAALALLVFSVIQSSFGMSEMRLRMDKSEAQMRADKKETQEKMDIAAAQRLEDKEEMLARLDKSEKETTVKFITTSVLSMISLAVAAMKLTPHV